jgi:hypothetical protein
VAPGVRRGVLLGWIVAASAACERPAAPPVVRPPGASAPVAPDGRLDAGVDGGAGAAATTPVPDAAATGTTDASAVNAARVLPVGHDELIIGRAGAHQEFTWRTSGGDVVIAVAWEADDLADDPLRVGVDVTRAGTPVWTCAAPGCELDCVGCDLGLAVSARDTLWIASVSWNKARTVPEGVRRLRWARGQVRVEEIDDPCRLAPRVLLWAEYCDELASD